MHYPWEGDGKHWKQVDEQGGEEGGPYYISGSSGEDIGFTLENNHPEPPAGLDHCFVRVLGRGGKVEARAYKPGENWTGWVEIDVPVSFGTVRNTTPHWEVDQWTKEQCDGAEFQLIGSYSSVDIDEARLITSYC